MEDCGVSEKCYFARKPKAEGGGKVPLPFEDGRGQSTDRDKVKEFCEERGFPLVEQGTIPPYATRTLWSPPMKGEPKRTRQQPLSAHRKAAKKKPAKSTEPPAGHDEGMNAADNAD
jgi:hypothetical protein